MTTAVQRLRSLSRAGRGSAHVSLDDHSVMRFIGAAQLAAGGLLLLVMLAVPDPDRSDHVAYTLLAGIGLVGAVVRWSVRRADMPVARAWNAGCILYIGGVVAVSRPVGPAAFLMLWPLLSTAYFLGRRDLGAALVLMAVTLLAGLTVNGSVAAADLPLELVPVVAIVGFASLTTVVLRERIDRLIADLERTASTDGLTGLPNRRSWNASFVTEIERARRSGQPLSIAIFDLDRFKAINDCLGHAEGDRALVRFATLLATECRSFDVPGRLGGEEFGLLLAGANAEGAVAFAERLRSRLELVTRHDETPFTVSTGVAELDVHAEDIEAMMLAADRALYRAKDEGRDRVVVADGPNLAPLPEEMVEAPALDALDALGERAARLERGAALAVGDLEARPATASRNHVGVLDLEPSAGQCLDEVNH